MKIHFKKSRSRQNLFFGCAWFILGLVQLFIENNFNWIGFGWLILAIIFFVLYYNQSKEKYILIKDGVLKENWKFGRFINLSEIKTIKEFAGDYIIKTETAQMTIKKSLIENDSLIVLDEKLRSLNAEWL